MPLLYLLLVAGCAPLASPPSAPTVAIEPASPTVDDDLRCVIVTESIDPDEQEVHYRYDWSVDEAWLGLDTADLTSDQTRSGEVWACRAYGVDESQDSEPSEPASVTIP